jgi:hypothetical protein
VSPDCPVLRIGDSGQVLQSLLRESLSLFRKRAAGVFVSPDCPVLRIGDSGQVLQSLLRVMIYPLTFANLDGVNLKQEVEVFMSFLIFIKIIHNSAKLLNRFHDWLPSHDILSKIYSC